MKLTDLEDAVRRRGGEFACAGLHDDREGKVVRAQAGFEFEHDGFDFVAAADDVVEYIRRLLDPDSAMLTAMASHTRFIAGDPARQWWIRELRDDRGRVVATVS